MFITAVLYSPENLLNKRLWNSYIFHKLYGTPHVKIFSTYCLHHQDILVQCRLFHPYPLRPVLQRVKISSLQRVLNCSPKYIGRRFLLHKVTFKIVTFG